MTYLPYSFSLMTSIEKSLSRSGKSLRVSTAALEQLVQDGYSLAYGARFLKRTIEDRIKLPISQRWTEGTHFSADVKDGQIAVEVSDAAGRLQNLAATA